MGGEVGVDSKLGLGSTFWFTARLGRGDGPQQRSLADNLQRKRALVVDDNANARLVLSDMLSSMSFEVDLAESGEAAIVAVELGEVKGTPYDIIFLDWQMPGMNGVETARLLRQRRTDHVPFIIMVTAYGREDVLKAAEEVGIDEVLIKPVSASVLFNNVVRILGGAQEGPRCMGDEPSSRFTQLSTLRGARILLVEDNELNQEVALELLREAGLEVDLAENGQIALDRLAVDKYDLVLMDMQMPVMDGVTATVEIRKQSSLRGLPVVAMTANAMQGDRNRCLAAGMNDHIAKPIEPEDLWKALLKWITPRQSGKLASPVHPDLPDDQKLPFTIEGLDMVSGLRRVLGKKHAYLSMLRRFVAGQKSVVVDIYNALIRDDPPLAERLAHTLKGASGTIGAAGVQQLAAELEDAIKRDLPREELEVHLAAVRAPLESLMSELVQKLPAEMVEMVAVMDSGQINSVCDLLLTLLSEGDSEALEVLDAHASLFRCAFPAQHPVLMASIRAFDFPSAVVTLRSMMETLPAEDFV
jgi:CheY-like chemotaxis protein